MTKSSLISHKADQRIVIVREDYLAICSGDHCAAAILNIFEYWSNIKAGAKEQAETHNAIALKEGRDADQDTSLWIYKTIPDIHGELLGLFGESKIGTALKILQERDYLKCRTNPKFAWDRTLQYLFNTEVVQGAILSAPSLKNKGWKAQLQGLSNRENKGAIPKTTSKKTSKDSSLPDGNGGKSKPSATRKADPEFDAIKRLWNTDASGFVVCLQGMLFHSKKVRGQWNLCKINPPATIDELERFVVYAADRMPANSSETLPTAAVTIQRYFMDFRAQEAAEVTALQGNDGDNTQDAENAPTDRTALLKAIEATRPDWIKTK